MAFDLDEDELRATREMQKLSDKNVAKVDEKAVNDDIKLIKNLMEDNKIEIKNVSIRLEFRLLRTLENILSEREQDKKKIKELEVKLECSKQLYDDCCKCLVDSIPKQLLKVKIQKLEETYKVALEKNSTEAFILRCQLEVLQELLEGGE